MPLRYADPGYLPDRKKRYPLEYRAGTLSPARIRDALGRFHQNYFRYTARQRQLIEGRIRGAGKRVGIRFTARRR